MRKLSKSKFISGVQCHKKLWLELFRPELKPPLDDSTQRLFSMGHTIGELAWMKFPNGKDATPESYDQLAQSLENTLKWLEDGEHTIYEASFSAENAFCMLDILHRNQDELWAIEVKNSTQVKEYHLMDAAMQFWTMSKSGFAPDRFYLMHLNNQYIKNGEYTEDLFTLSDITDSVLSLQPIVSQKLKELNEVTQLTNEPNVSIGPHCSAPFDCDFRHYCWANVPENSVFDLTRLGSKAWDLFDQGIQKMEDIPDDYPLTDSQILQINGLKFNEIHCESSKIQEFFKQWEFPLHFFDFETIMPALPVLDGTRPYQQVPFQYSLHILDENQSLKHYEFLAHPSDFSQVDPRLLMIQQMKQDFKKSGSIVTYNKSFEVSRLKELAEAYPTEKSYLYGLIDRIVDLYDIFRSRWYYHPAMRNSASIKWVLPALVPEFSYSDLEIGDGGTASEVYYECIQQGDFLTANLEKHLLNYCERDTYGMVLIYQFLQNSKISN
jgi:hypothetical protein